MECSLTHSPSVAPSLPPSLPPIQEGKEIQRTFEHVPSSVGALEAEEVGVEHLLRDINDPSVSTLANQVLPPSLPPSFLPLFALVLRLLSSMRK